MEIKISRYNNIEWLRFIFAAQVMIVHGFHHINDEHFEWITYFPGVPAFFFTSGFLIYASYVKSQSVGHYFRNRFLRLFPALLIVSMASLILAIWAKGLDHFLVYVVNYTGWFIGQITVGQAYNPAMFRDLGVGVLNGSLWTVTVEIFFYISVPIIVFLERYIKYLVAILLLISFGIYSFGPELLKTEVAMGKTYFEFLELTPLVWGWMFMVGVLFYKYYSKLSKFFPKFWLAVIPLLALILFDVDNAYVNTMGNQLGIIYFVFYVMLVMYVAFGVKYISLPFDLSYGVYIWHMVIINYLLMAGIYEVWLVFILTILIATLSWFLVEKPSLGFKKYSLRAP